MITGLHDAQKFRRGTLEPITHELQIIGMAWAMREQGMSLRAVAAELARLGHLSRTAKPFQPCQVAKVAA